MWHFYRIVSRLYCNKSIYQVPSRQKSRFRSVYILKYICSIYDSVRIVSLPSKFNKIALVLLISESIVLPLKILRFRFNFKPSQSDCTVQSLKYIFKNLNFQSTSLIFIAICRFYRDQSSRTWYTASWLTANTVINRDTKFWTLATKRSNDFRSNNS